MRARLDYSVSSSDKRIAAMSDNKILIQGGTVVNADGSQRADVYVEDR